MTWLPLTVREAGECSLRVCPEGKGRVWGIQQSLPQSAQFLTFPLIIPKLKESETKDFSLLFSLLTRGSEIAKRRSEQLRMTLPEKRKGARLPHEVGSMR